MSLYAGTRGYLDDVPVTDVRALRGRAARVVPQPATATSSTPSARPATSPTTRPSRRPSRPSPSSSSRDEAGGCRRPRREAQPDAEPATAGPPRPTPETPESVRTSRMAGGQERALRRRIRSVQSTKKITKAMELIAASRIVKAQQRVAAARPYSEQITEVIRNLAAAGAGGDSPLLSRARRRATRSPTWSSPPTGAWPAPTTARSSGPPSGRCSASGPRAARPGSSPWARRRRPTSASGAGTSTPRFQGFADQPAYEDARPIAEHVVDPVRGRASTTWSSWPTPSSCRWPRSGW